jgi:hypothetical protein
MDVRGWIYIITNPAMPGLVKVGYSTKDPTIRAKELGTTGNPHPYRVIYDALVVGPYTAEQRLHSALAHYQEAKEWFRCDARVVINTVRTILRDDILLEKLGLADPAAMSRMDNNGSSTKSSECRVIGCTDVPTEEYQRVWLCEDHAAAVRRGVVFPLK